MRMIVRRFVIRLQGFWVLSFFTVTIVQYLGLIRKEALALGYVPLAQSSLVPRGSAPSQGLLRALVPIVPITSGRPSGDSSARH